MSKCVSYVKKETVTSGATFLRPLRRFIPYRNNRTHS